MDAGARDLRNTLPQEEVLSRSAVFPKLYGTCPVAAGQGVRAGPIPKTLQRNANDGTLVGGAEM